MEQNTGDDELVRLLFSMNAAYQFREKALLDTLPVSDDTDGNK
jgi:hypothetical protein